jgi:hypothetical protein
MYFLSNSGYAAASAASDEVTVSTSHRLPPRVVHSKSRRTLLALRRTNEVKCFWQSVYVKG